MELIFCLGRQASRKRRHRTLLQTRLGTLKGALRVYNREPDLTSAIQKLFPGGGVQLRSEG